MKNSEKNKSYPAPSKSIPYYVLPGHLEFRITMPEAVAEVIYSQAKKENISAARKALHLIILGLEAQRGFAK